MLRPRAIEPAGLGEEGVVEKAGEAGGPPVNLAQFKARRSNQSNVEPSAIGGHRARFNAGVTTS
jgi:hypothetical protein